MPTQYQTIEAYISGAVCGPIWWPAGELCGKPLRASCRGPWGFVQKGDSFEDALSSLLCREGGDFQHARFTADTRIVVKRRRHDGAGKYSTHVREIEIARIAPDLVDPEVYSDDFNHYDD